MSQRLLDNTKWLWCLLALHAGSIWGLAQSVTRTPPGNPSTVEAQAKFFQFAKPHGLDGHVLQSFHFDNFKPIRMKDGYHASSICTSTPHNANVLKPSGDFFSVQLSPYKMEFGHVCEDPDTWEQRYEKKDFKNHRDMGKVRWGDKKGGYGEHYWDLNHAGHSGDNGNDGYDGHDSPYHESSNSDPYDEPSENSPQYKNDDYDLEKSSYEENGRAKRAHPKIKVERKHHKQTETYEEEAKPLKQKRKNKEELQAAARETDEDYSEDAEEEEQEEEEEKDEIYEKPKRKHHRKQDENQHQTSHQQPKEKKQFVLVVSQKDDSQKQKQHLQPQYSTRQPEPSQYVPKKQSDLSQYAPNSQPERPQYVPYESGAGVRQYQQPEISATTTVPRLFLEPSTGHVVDRATGQAYVLQPIVAPKNYN